MRRAARELNQQRQEARAVVVSDQSDEQKRQALTEIHQTMLEIATSAMGEETYSGRSLRRR